MKRFVGALGILLVLVLSMTFASLNGGQRITVRLGFTTLYGVPLTVIVFGSVLGGMLVMLAAGIRSDLKVRSVLRARLAEEAREERDRFIDRDQQDLFGAPDAGEETPTTE